MITRYTMLADRYLLHNRKHTLLTILGVMLSVALMAGTGTIFESTRAQMISAAIRDRGSHHLLFRGISLRAARTISAHGAVEKSGLSRISRGFRGETELELLHFSEDARAMISGERPFLFGAFPEKPGEIALDLRQLPLFGIGDAAGAVGRSVEIGVEDRRVSMRISGIFSGRIYDSAAGKETVLAGWEAPGEVNNLAVRLRDTRNAEEVGERLADLAGIETGRIEYNEMLLNLYGRGLSRNINRGLFAFTFIVIAIIVIATITLIYNSFSISMIERIREFGILRCTGASPAQLRRIIFREAFRISLFSVPPALLIGTLSMKLLFSAADAMSGNPFFSEVKLVVTPRAVFMPALLGFATVFISALLPAVRAGSVSAVDAVKSMVLFQPQSIPRPSGLRLPFPLLMAHRSIARSRKRFYATLFSMMISVTLYITFSGFLRLSMEANMLQDPGQPGFMFESAEPVSDEVYREIAEFDGVDTVYKDLVFETDMLIERTKLSDDYLRMNGLAPGFSASEGKLRISGCRIMSYGNGGKDHVVLVGTSAFSDSEGVRSFLPNSSFRVGDAVTLAGSGGRMRELRLTGIAEEAVFDNYNPREEAFDLIVDEQMFRELSGGREYHRLYISLKEGASPKAFSEHLDRLVRGEPGYRYIDGQAQSEAFTGDFRAVSLFFYGFIAVIALIGCVNAANSIGTNLLLRKREIAILRALGLDPGGIRLMLLYEGLIYALFAWLAGSTAGTGLWFVIVSIANTVRGTRFRIPWEAIGTAGAALLLVGLVAGLMSLRYIGRGNAPIRVIADLSQ